MFLQAFSTIAISIILVCLARVYTDYNRVKKTGSIQKILGPITLLPNESPLASVFGYSSRFVLGQFQLWLKKHDFYKNGWDISAAVSFWPTARTTLLIADPAIIKEICSNRTQFPKPTDQYAPLTFFGENIIASEGDEWKMYRKICAPAFSERNNRLVWEESIRAVSEFFDQVVGNAETFTVEDFSEYAIELGLHVISSAGFGKQIPWTHRDSSSSSTSTSPSTSTSTSPIPTTTTTAPANPKDHHAMSFAESFRIVSKETFLKLAVPDWVPGVTSRRLRRTRRAFGELKVYLQEMIHERRTSGYMNENSDLFSNLLSANDSELDEDEVEQRNKLDDSQLIGNMFIFLLAGHETTSHTLTFTLGLLALYPDEQEKLWVQIQEVCGPDRIPTYEDLPLLTRAMAILNETLRLFPSALGIPKHNTHDTSFTITNPIGDRLTVPVPKGTQIVVHPSGVHYNPRYWSDPFEFKPERFLGADWPRDAFIPFSAGARSCIGKRFAEIENIAMITMLIKHYKISIPDDEPQLRFKQETFEERKSRVLEAVYGITLTPARVPLTFVRREG